MTYDLQQKKVLITREEKQAKSFANKIREYNGIPIVAPLLKIEGIHRSNQEEIYQQLDKYEWIFFTSANGVNHFISQLDENEKKAFTSASIAVVGHKTEDALIKHGYKANFTPSIYNAEVLADEFFKQYKGNGPILLVRGNIARNVLPKRLEEENVQFDNIVVYETMNNMEIKEELNIILNNETIDFLTFTSPSTVDAFMNMVEADHPNSICVTIGTTTRKRAEKYHFKQILTPTEFTIDGMIQVMNDYLRKARIK